MNFTDATLRMQAGLLPVRDLPALACEALAAGHEGPVLRRLAELIGLPQWEVERRYTAALQSELEAELELPARTVTEAVDDLVRIYAAQIASGEVAPLNGASLIAEVVRSLEASGSRLEWRNEVRRIDGALEQAYDNPDARSHIEAEILAAARQLIRA